MKHSGTCACGSVRISLLTDPVMLYNCHCSHCRAFASMHEKEPRPYQQACAVWRWTVLVDEGEVEYQHTVGAWGLFSLQRGRCRQCKDPIWERGGRLAYPYCMVATKPLALEPDVNLYYDSGLKQGLLGLRTIRTDLGSFLFEALII